jgi:hypothetical protein
MRINQKKILSAVAVLAVFISLLFFALASAPVQAASGVTFPTDTSLPSGSNGIKGVVDNFMKWILGIFSSLAIISFVISGIMYFMLAGNEREVEKAKNQMTWSIIGVAVGLSGLIIITAVESLLSGSNTTF